MVALTETVKLDVQLDALEEGLSGVGRRELLERLERAVDVARWLLQRNREAHENLLSVQARCTAQLLELRELRATLGAPDDMGA